MRKISTLLGGLAVTALLTAGCGGTTAVTGGTISPTADPATITYRAIGGNSPGGHGGLVDVTYDNGQGGTQQDQGVLDGWSHVVQAQHGQTLTLSVQESRTSESVLAHRLGANTEPTECHIEGPGISRSATSTGAFSTATCSVTVP